MVAGSLDPALSDMMQTTVTVYESVTRDEYGQRTLGSGTSVSAYLRQGFEVVTTESGDDVPVTARLYMSDVLDVDPAVDVVELPDGSRPKIVASRVYRDENGTKHHEMLMLSRG